MKQKLKLSAVISAFTAIATLLPFFVACQNKSSLNIAEIKLGVSNWTKEQHLKYAEGERITPEEKLALKLDDIKDKTLSVLVKTEELAKGPTVYEGEHGRIETLVVIIDYPGEGKEFFEYIISYDPAGNYVAHLETGYSKMYVGDDVTTIIKGSSIAYKNSYCEPGEMGTFYIEYEITPGLEFKEIKRWNVIDESE